MFHPSSISSARAMLGAVGLIMTALQAPAHAQLSVMSDSVATLTFSEDFLGFADYAKIRVYGVGTSSSFYSTKDADGYYTSGFWTTPQVSVAWAPRPTYASEYVVTSLSTSAGLQIVSPRLSLISNGGAVQINNLSVDLATGGISGDLVSSSGTLTSLQLFNAQSTQITTSEPSSHEPDLPAICSTNWTPALCDTLTANYRHVDVQVALKGLQLTPQALNAISASLSLQPIGKGALNEVSPDMGDLTFSVAVGAPLGSMVSVIPEPSLAHMMALGMSGIMALAGYRRYCKS